MQEFKYEGYVFGVWKYIKYILYNLNNYLMSFVFFDSQSHLETLSKYALTPKKTIVIPMLLMAPTLQKHGFVNHHIFYPLPSS